MRSTLFPGNKSFFYAAVGITLCTAAPSGTSGQSLPDAIAEAYRTNPTLQSQRYQVRGLDEADVQALAGFRPTAEVDITGEYTKTTLGPANQAAARAANAGTPEFNETRPGQGQIILQQPLYTGGRATSELQAADADVMAGRQGLRSVEGDVVLSVIQAYTSVIRDQDALAIHRINLEALAHQLKETQARWRAGEVTLTDVAQAQAQLEAERALYASAQAQLQASRLSYTVVVGDNPGQLEPVPDLPGLPADVDQAFDLATSNDPEIAQARAAEEASRARVAAARAANRPTVSLRASFGYTGQVAPYDRRDFDRDFSAEAIVTQPIFTGGVNSSLIRQALDQEGVNRVNVEQARRTAVQNVANAWNQMLISNANVTAQQAQVAAAQTAFTGMTKEYRVGQRSTLDVLIAEETLRDAELSLVAAKHDAYVGAAAVLRYIGRLELRAIVKEQPLYDPSENTRMVRRKGAVPWEGAIQLLDALGAPGVGRQVIEQPNHVLGAPQMAAGAPFPAAAPLAVALPTAPAR